MYKSIKETDAENDPNNYGYILQCKKIDNECESWPVGYKTKSNKKTIDSKNKSKKPKKIKKKRPYYIPDDEA